jgi:CDP-2,3-bis-(O-geranylgeranyl)-sn-glycerol synthase
MTEILLLILQSLWLIAPAYMANGFPPLMGGKAPIDFGKSFRGARIFGDGKTWEGTVGGIIAGIVIGLLQVGFQKDLEPIGLALPHITIILVIALCVGTMVGDIAGSFLKRRMGMTRGQSAPLMDQAGFLIAAFIIASLVYALPLDIMIILLLITPPIHWLANIFGYYTKFKKTPW